MMTERKCTACVRIQHTELYSVAWEVQQETEALVEFERKDTFHVAVSTQSTMIIRGYEELLRQYKS